jgi:hypothetical protein
LIADQNRNWNVRGSWNFRDFEFVKIVEEISFPECRLSQGMIIDIGLGLVGIGYL